MKKSTIAVLGGTGKAGKYLVAQLIAQGFPLKLLVHHTDYHPPKGASIEIVQGSARDYPTVRALLQGCEMVVSTLGQPKGEKAPIFSQATRHVLQAMQEHHIQRYIVVTGMNINTPTDRKSAHTQAATEWMRTHYPEATADGQQEYTLLSGSGTQWTLIRLPLIEQTDVNSEISISLEDCLGDRISATSLAHFLINQLSDEQYIGKAPFIANAK